MNESITCRDQVNTTHAPTVALKESIQLKGNGARQPTDKSLENDKVYLNIYDDLSKSKRLNDSRLQYIRIDTKKNNNLVTEQEESTNSDRTPHAPESGIQGSNRKMDAYHN